MRRFLPLLAVTALAAGCTTVPLPPWEPTPPPPRAEPPPAQVAPQLVQEQRWLGEWFKDTPVQIGADDGGALRVQVPLEYSFDAGQASVKPPLAAVLDKVSESLLRQPATRVQVGVPAAGTLAVASDRAASLRTYLVTKGVQEHRIVQGPGGGNGVALRLLPPPEPIMRLEDAPPAAGRPTAVPRPVQR